MLLGVLLRCYTLLQVLSRTSGEDCSNRKSDRGNLEGHASKKSMAAAKPIRSSLPPESVDLISFTIELSLQRRKDNPQQAQGGSRQRKAAP